MALNCDKGGVFKNEIQQHFGVDLNRIPSVAVIDPNLKFKEIYLGTKMAKDTLALWFQKHIAVFKREGTQSQLKEWDG